MLRSPVLCVKPYRIKLKGTRLGWLGVGIALAYPMYQGPVWARNTFLTSEARKVFSFANYEISAPCFWMQEVNTLIFFLILWGVLAQWSTFYAVRRVELRRARVEQIGMHTLRLVTDTFIHWQAASVILGLGFIIFTGVFWDLVIVSGDRRYLLPAFVMHALWAWSWWIISLPLLITWQEFSRKKTELLLHRSQPTVRKEDETNYETLENLSPISLWNGIGSVATGILSFAFPILHAALK